MDKEQGLNQQPEIAETTEEIETKKQVWRDWAEQAKKEAPARRKLMEDAMTAFLRDYPEYTPD